MGDIESAAVVNGCSDVGACLRLFEECVVVVVGVSVVYCGDAIFM